MILPPFRHPAFRGYFGVARRNITPPLAIYSRNWGAAHHDQARSLHQPLTLTVLTMQPTLDSDDVVAIIALDLGWWRSAEEERLLAAAVEAAGIEEGRYFISLSHTHAGPVFCPGDEGKPGGDLIAPYLEQLANAIRTALDEARSKPESGWLETETGSCHLATHRDLPDPESSRLLVGWNRDGEADSTLLVGRVSREDGTPIAVLVNYACHPTILAWENTALSPDFPGTMRSVVERATGAPTLFLQGASGELAPRHQYTGDPRVAERAGKCLGHAVLSIWHSMLPPTQELRYEGKVASGAPLALWREAERSDPSGALTQFITRRSDISLAIRPDLPTLSELDAAITKTSDRVEQERLQRRRLIRQSLGEGTSVNSRHLLWQLGEIAFLSVPNEAYSLLQTQLRSALSPTPLFVSTVTNGTRGYLVPEPLYARECYTSWQTPFAPGELERTIALLQRQLCALAPT